VGLRRAKGPFRFEVTAYYTRFDGFIFRQLNGNTCDEVSCIAANDPPLELNQAIYSQRDANFRGGEAQFQWDLRQAGSGFIGIDGQYDIVRATFTDGTYVPRIPPQRLGGGVYWRSEEWFARVGLLHAFAQNNIGEFELAPTPGYNLLKAEVSRTMKLKNDPTGMRQVTLGAVGNNLLNSGIRNAVSYTKYEVLAPGASVRVFANMRF
jgi:iron complex outermembrane receptor protein